MVEGQITAEPASHGLPAAAAIEMLPFTDPAAQQLRHHIRIRRGKAKAPPVDCGYALRINFAEPVEGPICLGYASHFGLGRFEAIR